MYYMCSAKSIIVVCCSKHSQCVRARGSRGDEGKHSVRSSSTVSLASVSWNCYCAKAASAVSQSVSHSLSSGVCPPLPDRLHTAGFSRSHGCPLRVSLSFCFHSSHERPPPLPLHPSVHCQVTRLFAQMEMERK